MIGKLRKYFQNLNSGSIYQKPIPQLFKFRPDESDKFKWISELGICTVFDIGAHEGKTAMQFLEIFPLAEIHSFEPIPECFARLSERVIAQERCHVYNIAIGDKDGVITFHQSSYTPSSSILPMAKAHEEAFPFTQGGKAVEVMVKTLDSFTKSITLKDPIALKIDVQGFEWQVLNGAQEMLKRVKMVLIETSFVELYKDQKLFHDVYQKMTSMGFSYAGSFDQLFDPSNGKPIQQDAIFIK